MTTLEEATTEARKATMKRDNDATAVDAVLEELGVDATEAKRLMLEETDRFLAGMEQLRFMPLEVTLGAYAVHWLIVGILFGRGRSA